DRRPVEAVGPGAHAFDGRTRRWNAARLDAYLAALLPVSGPPRLPPGGGETLDDRTAALERVILGLRTARGVDAELAARDPLAPLVPWALERGLLEARPGGRLGLTLRGRLLSDELFVRLL
ncbi:MAG TPA: hypothetical protein VNJ28_00570, partial [Candidatus Limnocylindrales bacterium]|nr:hypothetical protein [Candidatus Limnocylindrales bacterium]